MCRLDKNFVPKDTVLQIQPTKQNPVVAYCGFGNKVTGRQPIDSRPHAALESIQIWKKRKEKKNKRMQDYHTSSGFQSQLSHV